VCSGSEPIAQHVDELLDGSVSGDRRNQCAASLFRRAEPNHQAVSRVIDKPEDVPIVSLYVVAELEDLVATRIGLDAELAILREVSSSASGLADVGVAELEQAASIIESAVISASG
jgi:predicted nucleic acid-binding protein